MVLAVYFLSPLVSKSGQNSLRDKLFADFKCLIEYYLKCMIIYVLNGVSRSQLGLYINVLTTLSNYNPGAAVAKS